MQNPAKGLRIQFRKKLKLVFLRTSLVRFCSGINQLTKNADETFSKFNHIKANVANVTNSVREITAGVNNQSTAINQSVVALQQFVEMAQKNSSFAVISEISNDLSASIEEVVHQTKETLDMVNAKNSEEMAFWDGVDGILQQIRSQMDTRIAMQAVVNGVSNLTHWHLATSFCLTTKVF